MTVKERIWLWFSVKHLTRGLPAAEARAMRLANAVQLTMFTLLALMYPGIIFIEPDETFFLSNVLLVEILAFMIPGRILMRRGHLVLGAALTLAGLDIHIVGLCIAFPDDPAHQGFIILTLIGFLTIPPSHKILRWIFGLTPMVGFLADALYFRVLGKAAIFGFPKWIVSADYYMPPLFLITVLCVILLNTFIKAVNHAEDALSKEHAASERLLMNILPEEIARELKLKGNCEPRHYQSTTVCFTDFVGFTQIAESMTPAELVSELDLCFSYFDSLMSRYNLEKLKTIGDSYMFAGGLPVANRTHAVDCVMAAIEIQAFMNQMMDIKSKNGLPYWELRLGIHSGELVAGVIGEKKFAYDVWSDTVNTASRCESSGVPGKINISRATYDLVKDFFECEHRGSIPAKHKGNIDMYFVKGLLPELQREGQHRAPNRKYEEMYAALRAMSG